MSMCFFSLPAWHFPQLNKLWTFLARPGNSIGQVLVINLLIHIYGHTHTYINLIVVFLVKHWQIKHSVLSFQLPFQITEGESRPTKDQELREWVASLLINGYCLRSCTIVNVTWYWLRENRSEFIFSEFYHYWSRKPMIEPKIILQPLNLLSYYSELLSW